MGSRDHRIMGSQVLGGGEQDLLPDFTSYTPPTSKVKTTYPKAIASEAAGGRAERDGGKTLYQHLLKPRGSPGTPESDPIPPLLGTLP